MRPTISVRSRVLTRLAGLVFCWAFSSSSAWSAARPLPVSVLEQNSDLILLARIEATAGDTVGISVTLQPVITLKGYMSLSPVTVRFLFSEWARRQPRADAPQASDLGRTGIWFLKLTEEGIYQVIPTAKEEGYTWYDDAFLPVPAEWSPIASTSLSRRLLSAVLTHYRALSEPTPLDENRLFTSLEKADRGDLVDVTNELMASSSLDDRVIGFAAAIRGGRRPGTAATRWPPSRPCAPAPRRTQTWPPP